MRGKDKGTMADVRRSLSGGRSIRPAGLVRQSMPSLIRLEHAVGTLPVVVKQQTRMPVRVTGDTQPIARKRLVLPRHSTSPTQLVMDPTSDAVRGRLNSERVCRTPSRRIGHARLHNVNTVAMCPLELVHVAGLSRGSKTSTTHTKEASTSMRS